jgi:hypothetical protein
VQQTNTAAEVASLMHALGLERQRGCIGTAHQFSGPAHLRKVIGWWAPRLHTIWCSHEKCPGLPRLVCCKVN